MDKWPTIEDIFTFDLPVFVVEDDIGNAVCRHKVEKGPRLQLFTDIDLADRFAGFLKQNIPGTGFVIRTLDTADALIAAVVHAKVRYVEFDHDSWSAHRKSLVYPVAILVSWVRSKFAN